MLSLTRDLVRLGVEARVNPQPQIDAEHGAHRGQEQGGGGAQHIDRACRAGQYGGSHRSHVGAVGRLLGSEQAAGVLLAIQ